MARKATWSTTPLPWTSVDCWPRYFLRFSDTFAPPSVRCSTSFSPM